MPGKIVSQHWSHDNEVKAQEFIHSDTISDKIIVGSSLAHLLVPDSLYPHASFFNIAFVGQSAYDGLELLKRRGRYPKTVFIETNMLLRGENSHFIEALYSPLPYNAKKTFLAIRDGKQPIALVGEFIGEWLKTGIQNTKKILSSSRGIPKDSLNTDNILTNIIDESMRSFALVPEASLFSLKMEKLAEYVKFYTTKNVKVVFFEMPMHPKLYNMPVNKILRDSLLGRFPEKEYWRIPTPDCGSYNTSDGMHLKKESARRYTGYFVHHLSRE